MTNLSNSQFNELTRNLNFQSDPDAALCVKQIEDARNDRYALKVYYCYPNGISKGKKWCYRASTNLINNGMRISDLYDTQKEAIDAANSTGRVVMV